MINFINNEISDLGLLEIYGPCDLKQSIVSSKDL